MPQATVIPPGGGDRVPGTIFKIREALVQQAFSIVEHPYGPRVLIPPHQHARFDQITVVLEGEVGIQVGTDVIIAAPGTYVHKPRGVPHVHWNAHDAPARVMEITFPGGLEHFFEELASLLGRGAPPAELAALGARYDTTFFPEQIPPLQDRYGVQLLGRAPSGPRPG